MLPGLQEMLPSRVQLSRERPWLLWHEAKDADEAGGGKGGSVRLLALDALGADSGDCEPVCVPVLMLDGRSGKAGALWSLEAAVAGLVVVVAEESADAAAPPCVSQGLGGDGAIVLLGSCLGLLLFLLGSEATESIVNPEPHWQNVSQPNSGVLS